uniref:Ribosomal protein L4 n=1 Tax=Babesia gibsoni TaxID=33632 RepID=A0A6M8NKZ8_BABGI|nr:ribosomal protein L4 [Babesia gibsoni]
MTILLFNLHLYFNINFLIYSKYNILLNNLNKYNISFKYISLYIKNIIKKLIFNLKNKINSTKSNSKKSKNYYSTSHIVRKGLIWYGLRQLHLKSYNNIFKKILILNIFNFRSNISLYTLESIKFLYYLNLLNNKYFKLILNNLLFNKPYIINNKSNKLLFKSFNNLIY